MPLQLTFVTSAKRYIDLPDSPGEIAFVGRSNVGKSSLINALANRRQLAKVSNTPGRTQLINMFILPNGATVVDLPGYGYAKVPGRERPRAGMIEGYLSSASHWTLVVLVDGEIGQPSSTCRCWPGAGNSVPYRWWRPGRQGQTVEIGRSPQQLAVPAARRGIREWVTPSGHRLYRCRPRHAMLP